MGPVEEAALALLSEKAEAQKFEELLEDIRHSFSMTPDRWLSCVKALCAIVTSNLEWMPPTGRTDWVTIKAKNRLIQAVTSGLPTPPPAYGAVEAAARPFIEWLAKQDDYEVLDFCWNVWERCTIGSGSKEPVYALHRLGRLEGEFSVDNIALAVSFAREVRAMDRWPEERWPFVKWNRDAEVYWAAMDHSSYIVRASAAHALGRLFLGCMKNGSANVTPVNELMEKIGAVERKTPGIAGAFLQGSEWNSGRWSDFVGDFDMRRWMLDTLRDSKRERDAPGQQALEFYAHELFQSDPDAIRELLVMGRSTLAVWTATQDPAHIEKLREVLDTMASSENAEVAEAIQAYLSEPYHHAGTEFLTERPFGN